MWKCKCGKVNQGDTHTCVSCRRTKRECLSSDNYTSNDDGIDLMDAVVAVEIIDEVLSSSSSYDDSSSYDSGSSDE